MYWTWQRESCHLVQSAFRQTLEFSDFCGVITHDLFLEFVTSPGTINADVNFVNLNPMESQAARGLHDNLDSAQQTCTPWRHHSQPKQLKHRSSSLSLSYFKAVQWLNKVSIFHHRKKCPTQSLFLQFVLQVQNELSNYQHEKMNWNRQLRIKLMAGDIKRITKEFVSWWTSTACICWTFPVYFGHFNERNYSLKDLAENLDLSRVFRYQKKSFGHLDLSGLLWGAVGHRIHPDRRLEPISHHFRPSKTLS